MSQQLSRPVQWWATVRALATEGIGQMIECGPGKVLTALNRRIERREGLEFMALEDPHVRCRARCHRALTEGVQKVLENKVALVTGASRGIGNAIAMAWGAGATVVGTSTSAEGASAFSRAWRRMDTTVGAPCWMSGMPHPSMP